MPAKTGPSYACDAACGPAVHFASAVNGISLEKSYPYRFLQRSARHFCEPFSVRFGKRQRVLHRVESSRITSFKFLCLCGWSAVHVSTSTSDYIFQVRYFQRKCAVPYLGIIVCSSTGILFRITSRTIGSAYLLAAGRIIFLQSYRQSPAIISLKLCHNCR